MTIFQLVRVYFLSIGASTSLSGLAGGLLAFLVVNWVAMESTKQIRCCLLCLVIMVTFITVMLALLDLSTKESNIDNLGHLGGFFTGALFALPVTPILNTSMGRHRMPGWTYERSCKVVGGALCFLWFAIGISMLYTQRDPINQCALTFMVK